MEGNIAEFSKKNREASITWEKIKSVNTDSYSGAIIRYAALWANLMEVEMQKCNIFSEIAERTSKDAIGVYGITGAMYGFAVEILSELWIHGEELRRWHNLKIQINDEGEKANESGGVLNPAILEFEF